ncbi:THO complex subunit 5 homolog [Limulus polyphemus]|uniref:THO complex subunit 5 homolog n=1 Tax=Limulus polyphemus TaxID=6850 RepID=A0ABM1C018_LIMPO|nr:THO complex subunit 5 homolog [Limulus polyphemus]
MSGQKKVKRTKTQGDEKNTSNSAASLQVPVVDSFLLEEEEAEKGDALQELNMFKNKCGEIREHAKEIVKLKKTKESEEELAKHRILASILFTDLKKLNRLDKHRCKNARDAVNEVKQKVDNFHLQLQNLMYEVMHLQKEVTKCLEFRSKDEEIDLVPEKEFFSEAPEAITKPLMSVQEESSKEKHRLTLARLEWELEQRKRLAEKLKETENMKQIYQQEIEKKKECLDNLKPRLKTILEATEPLHEELGIPLQATQLHHKGTELLSRPLYVLYVQAFAYKEVYDKQLEVKMEGNVEEARALQTTTQENTEEDSGESDQDDAPRVKHRRRPSAKGTESVPPPKKVLTRHPLTVRIMVSTSGKQD